MTRTLLNKRARIVQSGGWKYAGKIVDENPDFLWIHDEKSGRVVMLRKPSLLVLEELT